MSEEEKLKQNVEKVKTTEAEKVAPEVEDNEVIVAEPVEVIVKKEISPGWKPVTSIGKKVKNREITKIDDILNNGLLIRETEIVEALLPNLSTELLMIGQAKGKFGGGKRRVFRQTQKKTREGNKPKFATYAVVGNKDGFVGVGYGKSKETVPAREKALRNAKLNLMKISRGCGSWQCGCGTAHTIPFKVVGKSGSVILALMPAPKGTGLKVESECKKILELAGITDVWSKTLGQTKSKINVIKACVEALNKTITTKIHIDYIQKSGLIQGSIMSDQPETGEVKNE